MNVCNDIHTAWLHLYSMRGQGLLGSGCRTMGLAFVPSALCVKPPWQRCQPEIERSPWIPFNHRLLTERQRSICVSRHDQSSQCHRKVSKAIYLCRSKRGSPRHPWLCNLTIQRIYNLGCQYHPDTTPTGSLRHESHGENLTHYNFLVSQ
jgi:hypothetical protein